MDKNKLVTKHLSVFVEKYNSIASPDRGTFELFYYGDIMFDREGIIFTFARISER